MSKNIIIIILILTFAFSCKTYKYTYSSKETSFNDNLITYYKPKVESNYSIVPYVSVLGIGLGGGYLLGNHVHDNMISVGSPKDTAEFNRNAIYLAGALVAGYGFYLLYNDTSASEKRYIFATNEEINEWYANVVDYDEFNFIGTDYNKVYALKNKNADEYTTNNTTELISLYKKFTNPEFYTLRDSIIMKSYYKIPKNKHYYVYKETDRKHDIYLTDCLDYIDDLNEILEYAKEVKSSGLTDREQILKNAANKSYAKIKESNNLNDIQKWKDVFEHLDYASINRLIPSVNTMEKDLIVKKKREAELAELKRQEEIRLEQLRREKEEEERRQKEIRAEEESRRKKINNEREAKEIYNEIVKSRSKFVYNLQLGDCVSILNIKLIDMNKGSLELVEYVLNTMMIGLEISLFGDFNNLIDNNSIEDGKYWIPLNKDFGLALDIFTCKCIVKKINKKTNQVLIEVINSSQKCYSKDKHFVNAFNLIPCGG